MSNYQSLSHSKGDCKYHVVFIPKRRREGAGFAAAFAKICAVATAFLFPILLDTIGTRLLLYGLVITSLVGALVTWLFRIETTGVNLDRIGEAATERKRPGQPRTGFRVRNQHEAKRNELIKRIAETYPLTRVGSGVSFRLAQDNVLL
jgi:hypothetical protein